MLSRKRCVMHRLQRYFTPVFLILILIFLALYLKDIDYSAFQDLSFSWPLIVLATIVSLLFRYWGVVIWRFILHDLGAKNLPSFTVLSDVYAKSWMGRYIPGTVTWIASKVYMASRHGISKSRLTVSSVLEGGMQIVASMSISLLILGLDRRLDVISTELKVAMVVLAIVSLLVLLPPVLNRMLRLVFQTIRRKAAYSELQTNFRATFRSYLLYVIGSLIMGVAYYLLVISIYPSISVQEFWYIVGTFTLAGAVGMATPFVPSGIGVRDGVQLVLLSLIMPKEIALAITVFSRLWSVAVDMIFYFATTTLRRLT